LLIKNKAGCIMKILVLNSGSSSLKYAVFNMQNQQMLITGVIECISENASQHHYQLAGIADKQSKLIQVDNHAQGLQIIFANLASLGIIADVNELSCIGHRVVHGGEKFCQPTLVTDDVLEAIRQMVPLAPLHNPANIIGIEGAIAYAPNVPQVAVFDTAFHQTMPDYAYQYAVPQSWYKEQGVRRYGFHGTSHGYVVKQAAAHLAMPLESINAISLHLGNGASIAAIQGGKSIDTTMGMTPLEGLIMGTRSGDLDPAIIFYLQKQLKLSSAEIETALNKQSGLKGLCAENDMRRVHALADGGDEQAQLALAMVSYRIKKYIGAYAAILGRIDALIFTGGIGEHDACLRASCCSELGILGIEIEAVKNQQTKGDISEISADLSTVKLLVIATNEELEIAEQSKACVLN